MKFMNKSTHHCILTISQLYYSSDAIENTYGPASQQLIESLYTGYITIKERMLASVGASGLVLFKKNETLSQIRILENVPLDFAEAKEIQPWYTRSPRAFCMLRCKTLSPHHHNYCQNCMNHAEDRIKNHAHNS